MVVVVEPRTPGRENGLLTVKLGERESDVLRGLVQTGGPVAETEIIRGIAADAELRVSYKDAQVGVPRALRTLADLGLVGTVGNERNLCWAASPEGVRLIAEAEAAYEATKVGGADHA